MTPTEIFKDAYPEQLIAALRDEIRRAEREQQARDVMVGPAPASRSSRVAVR